MQSESVRPTTISSTMVLVVVCGMLLAGVRIWMGVYVPPEPASLAQVYKDVAHLFMGGLGVAWWLQRLYWQWALFVGLNLLEITVAIGSRL